MLPKLQLKLIAVLLTITTVTILAMAIYLISHFSDINTTEAIVMGVVAVITAMLITVMLVILMKAIRKPPQSS